MAKEAIMPTSERTSYEPERARLLEGLPLHESSLTLAGISTAVLRGGEGTPLVLLHGPGAYAAHWAPIMPALVARHHVIAPDLPGHGASQGADTELDGERVLLWLAELCAQTCTTQPIIVGELLGGSIAARFAIRYPERVSRLVLVDSFGLAPFQPAPDFMLALTQFQAEPSERTHDLLWTKCARDLPKLRGRMGELWASFRAYNIDRARAPHRRAALQCMMTELGIGAIPKRELAGIAVPTALIWGRHDLATPLEIAEVASRELGWPLFVVEGANDAPAFEQPEAFLGALERALAISTATRRGVP
jgi:pimeloyl-ACP methyl ester carboxylesterase